MRYIQLFILFTALTACTGVKKIDETWDCFTFNIPEGKQCKPIDPAQAEDPEWNNNISVHDTKKRNASTIQKLPEKQKPLEMEPSTKTPSKTWGN